MPDIGQLARRKEDPRNRPETAVEGVFARDVEAVTDLAKVIVPSFHRHQDFDCMWSPRPTEGGIALPQKGDRALVIFTDEDSWVPVWWPA